MREIKFRAWDKEIKKMCQISNIDFAERQARAIRIYESGLGASWENFDVLELMQYTGLKDKNDVEIYEGDLVQVEGLLPNDPFKVWFRSGLFHIGNWNTQGFMNAFDFYEVVGNIYENPELLEKE